MAKIIVGIISYLGNTPELQCERLKIHNNQLDWFKSHGFKKDEILIVSQHYEKNWYRKDIATYYDATFDDAKLKPGAARNYLLREVLYKSDYDWFILADNDSILDERAGFEREDLNIFNWIRNNDTSGLPECFVPVCPNVPGQGAWNKYLKDNKQKINSNWVFERGKIKTSFTFLKNLKKYCGFSLYFDDGKIYESGEDWAFGIELIKRGKRSMWCRNIVLKEMTGERSSGTWMQNNKKDHSYFQPLLRKTLAKQYGQDGIKNINKKLIMVDFHKKYPQTNSELMIPKGCGLFQSKTTAKKT